MYQGDSLKRTLLLDSPDQASLSIPREEELRSLGSGDWGKQKSTNCLLDSETVSLCSEETLGGRVPGIACVYSRAARAPSQQLGEAKSGLRVLVSRPYLKSTRGCNKIECVSTHGGNGKRVWESSP